MYKDVITEIKILLEKQKWVDAVIKALQIEFSPAQKSLFSLQATLQKEYDQHIYYGNAGAMNRLDYLADQYNNITALNNLLAAMEQVDD
jgi:hypothetical protein